MLHYASTNNYRTFFSESPDEGHLISGRNVQVHASSAKLRTNNLKPSWFRVTTTKEPKENVSSTINHNKLSKYANLMSASVSVVYFGPVPKNELFPPPEKVSFENINGNSVRLFWMPPEKTVQSYEIIYAPLTSQKPLAEEQRLVVQLAVGFSGFAFWFKKNNLNNYNAFIVHGKYNQTLLNVSQPAVVYDVRIRARFGVNQSVWASTLVVANSQTYSGYISLY